MNHEEHRPIFCQSYSSTSLFFLIARVFKSDKRIKEHLTSFLKRYAMLFEVDGRLFRVPSTYIRCMDTQSTGKVLQALSHILDLFDGGNFRLAARAG
jgi:hypothetical protein